jgi:hypothetical protein
MKTPSNVHLALVFKNFAYWVGYSSVGLNVAAITIAQELNRHGIATEVFGVRHNIDLFYKIRDAQGSDNPLTHVVIMAPWISPLDLAALAMYFPNIQFAVQSHCNVGALHGDVRGVGNLRNYMDLGFSYPNIHVAGNSSRFVEWARQAYDAPVFLLPNLYPLGQRLTHAHHLNPPINIGTFGAMRLEKNFITAVAAALAIQKYLDLAVHLHINVGGEVSTRRVLDTIQQMVEGVPGFTLVKHRWMPWDKFRELIRRMHILLQPSYTESFNMVTADGIANGVPSVVSTAITWAPEEWKADSDDALDIACRGVWLLEHLSLARWQGHHALMEQNAIGVRFWKEYLGLDYAESREVCDPECTPERTKTAWHQFRKWVKKLF